MLLNKVLAALILSQAVLAAPKPVAETQATSLTTTSATSTATANSTSATVHHQGKHHSYRKHQGYDQQKSDENYSNDHEKHWKSKGTHGKKGKPYSSEEYGEEEYGKKESGRRGSGKEESGKEESGKTPSHTTSDDTDTTTATSPTDTGKATPTSSAGSDDVQSQALAIHNKYRKLHHVPDVKWSTKLAGHAQTVTDSCVWGHKILEGAGQNIAYGYKSMEAAIDVWYNEGKNYNYGTNSYSSSTGHFTQVVWKSTTEIGCAATYCSNLKGTYYVCDYSPPGNYAGQYTANVLSP